MRVTNNTGISLPLAVWLLHDDYDYNYHPNYISVTTLMKPVKQIILGRRIPFEERKADVSDYIARQLGNSIHAGIEKAWKESKEKSLSLLGYSSDIIGLIRVNPTDEEVDATPGIIPVYLEQRLIREFDGYTIGGKFDMIADGIVQDNKSTSAWGWVFGTRDEEHAQQLGLYRWLDAGQPRPKITSDVGSVNYVFTDWQKAQARSNPKYPQHRVEQKSIALQNLDEIESFIRLKLALIKQYAQAHESELPECTDEELWRSAPQYRYFKDPSKANVPGSRSTKNFDTLAEAHAFKAQNGGVGTVITKPGEVKRCGYCDGFDHCTQKNQYFIADAEA